VPAIVARSTLVVFVTVCVIAFVSPARRLRGRR
jgi:hypothetical protein